MSRVTSDIVRRKHSFSLMETFEFLHLIPAHAAIQLPPAAVRLLDNTDLSDRIDTRQTLPDENLNLPQFCDNLFRLMPLVPISDPPSYSY